jgi:hypothetical protein
LELLRFDISFLARTAAAAVDKVALIWFDVLGADKKL